MRLIGLFMSSGKPVLLIATILLFSIPSFGINRCELSLISYVGIGELSENGLNKVVEPHLRTAKKISTDLRKLGPYMQEGFYGVLVDEALESLGYSLNEIDFNTISTDEIAYEMLKIFKSAFLRDQRANKWLIYHLISKDVIEDLEKENLTEDRNAVNVMRAKEFVRAKEVSIAKKFHLGGFFHYHRSYKKMATIADSLAGSTEGESQLLDIFRVNLPVYFKVLEIRNETEEFIRQNGESSLNVRFVSDFDLPQISMSPSGLTHREFARKIKAFISARREAEAYLRKQAEVEDMVETFYLSILVDLVNEDYVSQIEGLRQERRGGGVSEENLDEQLGHLNLFALNLSTLLYLLNERKVIVDRLISNMPSSRLNEFRLSRINEIEKSLQNSWLEDLNRIKMEIDETEKFVSEMSGGPLKSGYLARLKSVREIISSLDQLGF